MPIASDRLAEPEDLAAALGLLTRLPVPVSGRGAKAAWAWPMAGVAVALICGLAGKLFLAFAIAPGIVAGLLLALGVLLTGAMHEDGLADSADGLFGGWEPARRLEIMKDSRVGSYGVLALVTVTLLRWQALTFLISAGHLFAPLLAAAALSRAALPMAMLALPPARPSGLSAGAGRPPEASAALGLGIAVLIALLTTGWAAIPAILAAGLAATAMGALAQARIGGQTGDILGAMQVLAEVAALIALGVLLK